MTAGYAKVDSFGRLEVACWCSRSTVWIPAEQVGEMTASCGDRDCVPPSVVEARAQAEARERAARDEAARRAVLRDPRQVRLTETLCSECFRPVFSASSIAVCNDCRSRR